MSGASFSACPACDAAPLAQAQVAKALQAKPAPQAQIILSLPSIHCAGCISKVERALLAHEAVQGARVNLTLKRAIIDAPTLSAEDVLPLVRGMGYEANELDTTALAPSTDETGRALLMRLAVAGFAAMNVMLLSVSVWSGASDATRDLFHWISALITVPSVAFSGQPFFVSAAIALRHRQLNMDVPIALAILLAVVTSLWETALSGHHAYFDAALALTFFLLTGRYLDHRTRIAARSAAAELAALEVPRAVRLGGGKEEIIAAAEVRVGDLILVRAGGRIPIDGEVIKGCSEVDRSFLTGESMPVAMSAGARASAGEVNLSAPLEIRATAVGRDTSLARITNLVAVAESGRARYTSLADRAAKLYAPGVHILAALSFLSWLLWSGDMRVALNIAAAVLIITCPCALGLAVPAVTTAASARLFRAGLLIKDATALERLAEIDHVVLDKTGTLTQGVPQLLDHAAHSDETLALAGALAQASSHPLSRALCEAASDMDLPEITDVREQPGLGMQACYRGQRVRLGRAAWLGADEADMTATYLQVGKGTPYAFFFTDRLREGAAQIVAEFQAAGLPVTLLSGDTQAASQALAKTLGIADWRGGVLPDEKAAFVASLGAPLMIGDGLNDTAALVAAHVSLSPASALDAARAASDIVLLGQSLAPISDALKTAKSARRRIQENFSIATVYNIIAVPLAVAGLATPLIAALAMSASSLTVSLNALRLR